MWNVQWTDRTNLFLHLFGNLVIIANVKNIIEQCQIACVGLFSQVLRKLTET